MKLPKIWLLTLILILAACQTKAPDPKPHRVEGQVEFARRISTTTPDVFPGPTPSPADGAIESFGTEVEITLTAIPTELPTPTWSLTKTTVFTNTPAITTTIELTAIPGITQTGLITTATILTATWTYSDIQIVRKGAIQQVAWSPDGSTFAAATSLGVFVVAADTFDIVRSFNIGEKVQSVAFSPTTGFLVTGGLNGDIHWWNPTTGGHLASLDAHRLGITDLGFPASGDFLVSGSDDGTVRLWVTSNVLNQTIDEYSVLYEWRIGERVTTVAINSTRQLVAAGSFGTVFVWDSGTGENHQIITDLISWVAAVAFSPDGNLVISKEGEVTFLDVRSGRQVRRLTLSQSLVTSIVFNREINPDDLTENLCRALFTGIRKPAV